MKNTIAALLLLSATTVFAANADNNKRVMPNNFDGVTKANAMERASARFDRADSDRNGTLSKEELRAAKEKRINKRSEHRERLEARSQKRSLQEKSSNQ